MCLATGTFGPWDRWHATPLQEPPIIELGCLSKSQRGLLPTAWMRDPSTRSHVVPHLFQILRPETFVGEWQHNAILSSQVSPLTSGESAQVDEELHRSLQRSLANDCLQVKGYVQRHEPFHGVILLELYQIAVNPVLRATAESEHAEQIILLILVVQG